MRWLIALAVVVGCEQPRAARSVPTFQVWVDAPGYGTTELERYVTIPLETALRANVRSLTTMDRTVLTVEVAGDMLAARQAASKELENAQLPEGLIAELGPMTSEQDLIVRYVIRDPRPALRDLQDWKIRARLLQLPGVADVSTCGGGPSEVEVMVDPIKAAALNLSYDAIHDAIGHAFTGSPAGTLGMEGRTVRVDRDRATIGELGALPVGAGRIADVATISLTAARPTCWARASGPVIEGLVWARTGGDRAATVAAVTSALSSLSHELNVPIEPVENARPIEIDVGGGDPVENLATVVAALRTAPPTTLVEVGQSDGGIANRAPDQVRVIAPPESRVALAKQLSEALPTARVIVGEHSRIRIAGAELEILDQLAAAATDAVAALPDHPRAWSRTSSSVPHLTVEIDRTRAAALGIGANITKILRAASDGDRVGSLAEADHQIDIVLRIHALPDLGAVQVAPSVPLSAIASTHVAAEPRSITRVARGRAVELETEATPAALEALALPLPAGYAMTVEPINER